MDKETLRVNAKNLRRTLDITILSMQILQNILALEEYKRAKNVLLFYPLENELNLLALCNEKKNFFLPKVAGDKLLVCPYDCNTQLEKSELKIYEPCSTPQNSSIIDFAIIPCLMADRTKNRLGYGKGFYDRFIPLLSPECIKIAPVPFSLIVDTLPTEEHDCKVDLIVSEKSVF